LVYDFISLVFYNSLRFGGVANLGILLLIQKYFSDKLKFEKITQSFFKGAKILTVVVKILKDNEV